ncbi:MFS transporter [Streptomyces sp. B6B3]|uniref:MFS transporter n=1 Tax=Streptomyces sp. B6B3 TaxID=3153570 RepID=UPI00325EC110
MTNDELTRATSEERDRTPPAPVARRGLGGNFWKLFVASTLGNLGQGVTAVALPWLATTLTTNAFLIALVGVAQRLPWLVFSLHAGALADRLDRRRLMVAMSLLRALVLGGTAVLIAADAMTLPVLLVCALVLGFVEVLFDNTAQVILPAVVDRAQLPTANGRVMSAQIVTDDFFGRPLGGLLLGVALAVPFAFDAGMALVAALALFTLRGAFRASGASADGDPADKPPRRSMRAEIAEGVRWLWGHSLLRPMAIALAVTNAAGQGALAIYVLYAQEILHLGPGGFAVLISVGGVGGLLGGLLAGRASRRLGPGRSLVVTLLLELAAFATAAFTSNAYLVGAVMGTLGFGVVLWNVVTVSLRQTIIPDRLLGRVNSVYRLLGWGCMPLGMALGGGLVALVEELAGREAGLRAPFLAVVLVLGCLLLYVRRHLNGRAIEAALAAAER